jgi:hypothetical protein
MHERLRAVAREPILHFLLLGVLAFVLYSTLVPGTIETIVVAPETLRRLEARRSEILGRPLTEEERTRISNEFVEEEILIREAYRRGLERHDSRVRDRLLALMRATLDETLPEPGREQLETYFWENIDRYWDRESITFTHVLFPQGSEATPEDDAAFLKTLARGEFDPPADPRAGILETRTATPGEIRSAMGPEASRLLLSIDGASWEGPIDSPLGAHYVKIVERSPLPQPTFDAMLAYVRGDWELEEREKTRSRKIAEIGESYRIVVAEE